MDEIRLTLIVPDKCQWPFPWRAVFSSPVSQSVQKGRTKDTKTGRARKGAVDQ